MQVVNPTGTPVGTPHTGGGPVDVPSGYGVRFYVIPAHYTPSSTATFGTRFSTAMGTGTTPNVTTAGLSNVAASNNTSTHLAATVTNITAAANAVLAMSYQHSVSATIIPRVGTPTPIANGTIAVTPALANPVFTPGPGAATTVTGWADRGNTTTSAVVTPNSGFEVWEWTVDGTATVVTANTQPIPVINAPVAVTVELERIGHGHNPLSITVNNSHATDSGALANAWPTAFNGGNSYPINATNASLPLTFWASGAAPSGSGYGWFDGWTVTPASAITGVPTPGFNADLPRTAVYMPSANVVATANWRPAFMVEVSFMTAYGTVGAPTTTGNSTLLSNPAGNTTGRIDVATPRNVEVLIPNNGTFAIAVNGPIGAVPPIPAGYAPRWSLDGGTTWLSNDDSRLGNNGWQLLSLGSGNLTADVDIRINFEFDPGRPHDPTLQATFDFGIVGNIGGIGHQVAATRVDETNVSHTHGPVTELAPTPVIFNAGFEHTVTFVADPGVGYELVGWTINGYSPGGAGWPAGVTFTNSGLTLNFPQVNSTHILPPDNTFVVRVEFEPMPFGVQVRNDFENLIGARSNVVLHTALEDHVFGPGAGDPILFGDAFTYIMAENNIPGQRLFQFELVEIRVATVGGVVLVEGVDFTANLTTRTVNFNIDEVDSYVVTYVWDLRRFDVTINYVIEASVLPLITPTRTITGVRFGDSIPLTPEEALAFSLTGPTLPFWYNADPTNPFYGHVSANPAWSMDLPSFLTTNNPSLTTIGNTALQATMLNNVRADIGVYDIDINVYFARMLRNISFAPTINLATNASDFSPASFNPVRPWNDSVTLPTPIPPAGTIFEGWTITASRPNSLTDAWAGTPSNNFDMSAAEDGGPFNMPATNLTFTPRFTGLNDTIIPQRPNGDPLPKPVDLQHIMQGYAPIDLGVVGDPVVNIVDFRLFNDNDTDVTGISLEMAGGSSSPFIVTVDIGVNYPTAAPTGTNMAVPASFNILEQDYVMFNVRPVQGLLAQNATTPREYTDTIRVLHNGITIRTIPVIFRVDPQRFTITIEHHYYTTPAMPVAGPVTGFSPATGSPESTDGVFAGSNITINAGAYTGHRVLEWRFYNEGGSLVDVVVAGMPSATNTIELINPLNSIRTITMPGDGVTPGNIGENLIARAMWVNDNDPLVRHTITVRNYVGGNFIGFSDIVPSSDLGFGVFGNLVTGHTVNPEAGVDRAFGFWRVASTSPSLTATPVVLNNTGLVIGATVPNLNDSRTISFMMPRSGVVLEAHWLPSIVVTVQSDGAHGFYANDGQGMIGQSISNIVTSGQTVQISAGSKLGYHFTGWTFFNTDTGVQITGADLAALLVANASSPRTSFRTPSVDVTAVANWSIIPGGNGGNGNGDNGNGDNGNGDNGNGNGGNGNGDNGNGNGGPGGNGNGDNGNGGPGGNGNGGNGNGDNGGPGGNGNGGPGGNGDPGDNDGPWGGGNPGEGNPTPDLGDNGDNGSDNQVTGDNQGQVGGNEVTPPSTEVVADDDVIVQDEYQPLYDETTIIPGPFFSTGSLGNGIITEADYLPYQVQEGLTLPDDMLADTNVPGIVWQNVTNPQTGDEQSTAGLIASAAALLLSSAILLIIVAKRRKDKSEEVEKVK